MDWRTYDPQRDLQACRRIWYETGWLRPDRLQVLDSVLQQGPVYVADVDGSAECLVVMSPGSLRYGTEDLPFSGVQAVTTSRVGRRQGLAARLTAQAVAEQAAAGTAVAGLGMFDQGFYDKLGFGTGGYEHMVALDPLSLTLDIRPRRPSRLGVEHALLIHDARLRRARGHGSLVFRSAEVTRSDMLRSEHAFGLGYFSGTELTHCLWAIPETDNRTQGPFRIVWLSYRNGDELKELLSLLGELGDQVGLVRLREPPRIQLQDLIRRPLRGYYQTSGARLEPRNDARAYWQMRICDLGVAIRAVRSPEAVAFNLILHDPIADHLPEGPWRGGDGRWIVYLDATSEVVPGTKGGLPQVEADLGTFTRLWLGVRPATSLATTGRLAAPPHLHAALDRVFLLPEPKPDWDF